jgi:serine/threonine protein kinase
MDQRNSKSQTTPGANQPEERSAQKAFKSGLPRGNPGTFADRYEIVDKIGIGGMAAIYKVRDLVADELLAIKIIRPEIATNDISHKRFRQEARAARDLNHPNIVSVRSYDISPEGVPYLIMDYVDGIDLSKVLRKSGPVALSIFFPTFIQVSGALVHAHSRGVVHRDVKPSNILLTTTGDGEVWAKLVDFGIAKLLYPTDNDDQTHVLTKQGQTVGSPSYMSPEQVQGKQIDARSDIYSLGCVMFEALAGRLPFKADNALQLAMHHVYSQPINLKKVTKNCPMYLDRVVAHCLAKKPDDRYQNMFDLRSDLQLVEQGKEPLCRTSKSSTSVKSNDDWFEQLIKKDTETEFVTVLHGQLSYEQRLNNVLEQINELGYPGDSILKLQSQDPPFSGVILIRDGRQVIGARLQGSKQKIGYEALRRLISMADGEFQYFNIKGDDYSLPDTLFRLNLNYILSLYPNLPESPADLEDENAIHELVFAVESDTRTDWAQVTPVDNLLNKLDHKNTDWRPMSAHTPESTPTSDFVSREELLDALAREATNRGKTTAQQTALQRLFKRLFRCTTSTAMVIVVIAAMMAMGYEIVKTTIKNLQGSRIHQRKRRLIRKRSRNQTWQPVDSTNKITINLPDGQTFIFKRRNSKV